MNHVDPFSTPAAAARKILCRRFWCANGWTDRPFEPGEEQFCRQQGYWFADRGPTAHEMLMEALPKINAQQIGRAFVASFERRVPELRSALGSFGWLRSAHPHVFNQHEITGDPCSVCGISNMDYHSQFGVFNFERVKWGGVRHDDCGYAAFDMACFTRFSGIEPTCGDVSMFRILIAEIRSAPPRETAAKFVSRVTKIFPSSKDERTQVLESLAWAGIIPDMKRPYPDSDWSSPAACWRAGDGLDERKLNEFFGEFQ